jgi:hypothetical protein
MHTFARCLRFSLALGVFAATGCTKNVAPVSTVTKPVQAAAVAANEQIIFKPAASKPPVRKKSCEVVAPFELDCAADALYSGVEPMHHPIDDTCPTEGMGSSDALKLEYATKNSLCLTGAPTPITIGDLLTLQTDLDQCPALKLGNAQSPPGDRRCLSSLSACAKKLREGTSVRLVGYVVKPHANTGEGVNCKCTDVDANDLHITIVTSKGDLDCSGIVTEMIPHFRPAEWSQKALSVVEKAGTPVRIEGPLFADISHLPRPCGEKGRTGDPPRSSVWEIHPIKRFQVCAFKTRKKCKQDDDSVWSELPSPTADE